MKSSKGLYKVHARLHDLEYNDYPLEVPNTINTLEDGYLKALDDELRREEYKQNPSQSPLNTTKQTTTNQTETFSQFLYNEPNQTLTSSIIEDLIKILGKDAERCYYGLYEYQNIEDTHIPDTHGELYYLFQTIPVIFLSIDRDAEGAISTVYLWQVNKLCPWSSQHASIHTDLRPQFIYRISSLSLMVLSKMTPENGEVILEAKLISGVRLVVTSRVQGSQIVYRIYNIADLYGNTKINPYKEMSIGHYECIMMLTAQPVSSDESSEWVITLLRPQALEEIDLTLQGKREENADLERNEEKGLPQVLSKYKAIDSSVVNQSPLCSPKELLLETLLYTWDDQIILLDKVNLQLVILNAVSLKVISLEVVGAIKDIQRLRDLLFIVNQLGKLFKLSLAKDFLLEPFVTLPLEALTSNDAKTWQVVELVDDHSSETVLNLVYLKNSIFYLLLLNEGQEVHQPLTEVKKTDEKDKNISWQVLNDDRNADEGKRKSGMLVYFSGGSITFYDIANKDEKSANNILQGQSSNTECRIISMRAGHICLHADDFQLMYNEILDIKYPSKPSQIFKPGKVDIKITKIASAKRAYGFLLGERDIQISGRKKQIILVRFALEPFYHDKINRVYYEKGLLVNNIEKIGIEQANKIQRKNIKVEAREKLEQARQEELQKLDQKVNEVKQGHFQGQSAHLAMKNCSKALADLREKIRDQVSGRPKDDNTQKKSEKSNNQKQPEIEYMEAYKSIKDEKKKLAKQRDKEKAKTNKRLASNKEKLF